MFLDDLEADGVELAPPTSGTVSDVRVWINAAFWTWYKIHSGDVILRFTILGVKFRKWTYADLHRAFELIFGEEPAPEAAADFSDVSSS